MSNQYVPIKREWLEGLLEKAGIVNAIKAQNDNALTPTASDEMALAIAVATLLGYISSSEHLLERSELWDDEPDEVETHIKKGVESV